MNSETTLDVIDQTEVFTGLVNGDDIWKSQKMKKLAMFREEFKKNVFLSVKLTRSLSPKRLQVRANEKQFDLRRVLKNALEGSWALKTWTMSSIIITHAAKLTHESGWVVNVSANLAVDFDESLHDDLGDFGVCQSVLQAITQKDHQGQRFTQLVWTGWWTWGEGSTQFVQHPCFRCC